MRSNKLVGDKQFFRVVVNHLMAQRKAYRRRTKQDVIPALVGKKGAPVLTRGASDQRALQPANGKATNGKVDPIDIPPSEPVEKKNKPQQLIHYMYRKTTTNH